MSLSAVVVNYRTPADLRGFIDSFEAHPPRVDHDLTVVNVAPEPSDRLVAQSYAGRYIEFTDNVGYARACNRAALVTKGDILAFFNADVRLTPRALDNCYQALRSNLHWAVLSPRQIDDVGRLTHAGIFGTPTAPKHRAWHERDRGQYQDVQDAVTVSGAAYFIKRAAWDELTRCEIYRSACDAEGAFLPTPFYFEETFCSYHARAHGWSVIYFGAVTVVHTWHQAVSQNNAETWAGRCWEQSKRMFREACDLHGIEHD
jgi:GT2 family glycosyltransferase